MLWFSSFLGSLNIYPPESGCLGYIFIILWLLMWDSGAMDLYVPYRLCVPFCWNVVVESKGVFVTVAHKMQWCSPCTSESILVLLQNRTSCLQQR